MICEKETVSLNFQRDCFAIFRKNAICLRQAINNAGWRFHGNFGTEPVREPVGCIQQGGVDLPFNVLAVFGISEWTVHDVTGMFVPIAFIQIPQDPLTIGAG